MFNRFFISFSFLIAAPVPTFLTEQALYDIIDECESNDSYSPLIRTLGEIFSSIENLSKSFLQEASTPTDSATNLDCSGELQINRVKNINETLFNMYHYPKFNPINSIYI